MPNVLWCKKMILEQVQQKVGYIVAIATGSTPAWVGELQGYLEIIAVLVAIGVGISTWRLNRAKRKKIEKSD